MTELFVNAFIQIRVWDILDVLLVGLLFYGLYYLVKGTTAIKIFFGIVAIILGLKVVTALHMELLSYILGAFVNVGFGCFTIRRTLRIRSLKGLKSIAKFKDIVFQVLNVYQISLRQVISQSG